MALVLIAICILLIVRMSLRAVTLCEMELPANPDDVFRGVDLVRDGPQVLDIAAGAVPALVVDLKSFRYRPIGQFPDVSVHRNQIAPGPYGSIALPALAAAKNMAWAIKQLVGAFNFVVPYFRFTPAATLIANWR